MSIPGIKMDELRSDNFLLIIKEYTAVVTIGASTLRNQGGVGVIDCAREFLIGLDLHRFVAREQSIFDDILDEETDRLLSQFPVEGRPWGTSRKAINLFMREVLYNRYLCEEFSFHKIEKWLEVPLDSAVVNGLKKRFAKRALPVWPGLKHLTKDVSEIYQAHAQTLANQIGFPRVHLDPLLWVENR